MPVYDLCIAWNWEHDADFVRLLESTCSARGLTLLSISTHNLQEILPILRAGDSSFRMYFDRASEADPAFLPLVDIARSHNAHRLNPRELADRAYNKAEMHHAFINEGIPTPQTIILPAYDHQPDLPIIDPARLGGQCAVKPAFGGGGEGVVTEVSSFEQILVTRRQFPEQQYLLQEHLTPKMICGIPAWFRILYCLGRIHACFWDVKTHIYTPLTTEAQTQAGLESLHQFIERIAGVCHLDIFSSEIAWTKEDRWLVVDYVNDPIDLRLQSRAIDGVPDFIAEDIAARIAEAVGETKNRASW